MTHLFVKHYRLVLSLGLVLFLTGCASAGSSTFTCPSPSTGMCSSVGTVDTMVKTGQLNNNQSNNTVSASNSASNTSTGDFGHFSTPFPDSVITPGAPLRIQEQVMPVWFAPYQDKQGNYHDAATMYIR